MLLGAFSVSLAVKDLTVSRAFYEKLGFEVVGGEAEQNWQIMRSGTTTIGLFQGMFEENILTFNPGWDAACNNLEKFDDVRDIQSKLEAQGIELEVRADDESSGPASLIVVDPDGNRVMLDQHVPRPA